MSRSPRRAGAQPPALRSRGALCVVVHDVAPVHAAACRRLVGELEMLARHAGVALPLTLLVVPQHHGQERLPRLHRRWLHEQQLLGHELALHGFTHRDDGTPSGWRDWLLRRIYTAGEGEFAALSHDAACQRLAQGLAWAARHGLRLPGFVAPAWLMSPAAHDAVLAAGFGYTCTLEHVIALPSRAALRAPAIVYSTRSAWRRAASLAWTTLLARRERDAPLLRLELHPGDIEHAAIRRAWQSLLVRALHERQPLTLSQAAALAQRSRAASTLPRRGPPRRSPHPPTPTPT